MPTETIAAHNPALRLDWERFCSEKLVNFAAMQARIIRELVPGAVITHDFPGGGPGKTLDYTSVAAPYIYLK